MSGLRPSEATILALLESGPKSSSELRKLDQGRFSPRTFRESLRRLRALGRVTSSEAWNPIHCLAASSGNEAATKAATSGNESGKAATKAATDATRGVRGVRMHSSASLAPLPSEGFEKKAEASESGADVAVTARVGEAATEAATSGNESGKAATKAATDAALAQALATAMRILETERAEATALRARVRELEAVSLAKTVSAAARATAGEVRGPIGDRDMKPENVAALAIAAHPANSRAAVDPAPELGTDSRTDRDEYIRLLEESGHTTQVAEAAYIQERNRPNFHRAVATAVLMQAKGEALRDAKRFIGAAISRDGPFDEFSCAGWGAIREQLEAVRVPRAKRSPGMSQPETVLEFPLGPGSRQWTDAERGAWAAMDEAQKDAVRNGRRRAAPVSALAEANASRNAQLDALKAHEEGWHAGRE